MRDDGPVDTSSTSMLLRRGRLVDTQPCLVILVSRQVSSHPGPKAVSGHGRGRANSGGKLRERSVGHSRGHDEPLWERRRRREVFQGSERCSGVRATVSNDDE